MRRLATAALLLAVTESATAFTITPVPGAGQTAGLLQFVAAGLVPAASSPFFQGGPTQAAGMQFTLAPEAYRGTFQVQAGQFLIGTQGYTLESGFARPAVVGMPLARFGLTPSLTGTSWTVGQAQIGYLASDTLLFYTGVSRAQPTATAPHLPIPPGIGLRDEQRGLTAARAGVQWQAMPGLTLGVELSGIGGTR